MTKNAIHKIKELLEGFGYDHKDQSKQAFLNTINAGLGGTMAATGLVHLVNDFEGQMDQANYDLENMGPKPMAHAAVDKAAQAVGLETIDPNRPVPEPALNIREDLRKPVGIGAMLGGAALGSHVLGKADKALFKATGLDKKSDFKS